MVAWDELLARLAEQPRENGTAAIHQTAAFLEDALRRGGAETSLFAFEAHPYGLRLAGVLALAGALLYARLLRARRYGAALAVALVTPALLLAQLDWYVPLFAGIGAQTQHHVIGRIAPAQEPVQRILLAAHYDTKTDLLDHVERAPIQWLALPAVPLMLLGALAGLAGRRARRHDRWIRRTLRAAGIVAVVYGAALFAALSAGAFVPARSPGALDDGASCAVLVRLAGALAEAPPERTAVEILLLSAEEVGVQGSWVYAADRFARPPALPTAVVNLEGLGSAPRHRVLPRETFTLRSFRASPELVSRLDLVHRARFGAPLEATPYGGATDARSFLAHGVAAATLVTLEPGSFATRDLHSAGDDRTRLDRAALEESVGLLLDFVREVDARPLGTR